MKRAKSVISLLLLAVLLFGVVGAVISPVSSGVSVTVVFFEQAAKEITIPAANKVIISFFNIINSRI